MEVAHLPARRRTFLVVGKQEVGLFRWRWLLARSMGDQLGRGKPIPLLIRVEDEDPLFEVGVHENDARGMQAGCTSAISLGITAGAVAWNGELFALVSLAR